MAQDRVITTADGRTVGEGARVFDYYGGAWGTVGRIESDGWFTHTLDDGARGGYLNGERVCKRIPPGNPFYRTHGGTDGYGTALTCDWGPSSETATRVTDDDEPLCDTHAREHYGAGWRTETKPLSATAVARVLAARA
jgi:hypothetical protein